jgi:formate--tetrahydrofolate ligase
MASDLEIARQSRLRPLAALVEPLGLSDSDLDSRGRGKAKIPLELLHARSQSGRGQGKLILVTGMSPTPAGEGKSTVAVGLADALQLRQRTVMLCLRQPSLGPVFGMKGGATGGGWSQVIPMEDINLHFTGDFHAITSAQSLLAALIDNHLHQGNERGLDPRRIVWRRAVDMNDRALRSIVVGLGGTSGGVPREDGFVITAASETMAIFALASGIEDLQDRLNSILVGYDHVGAPVFARDLEAAGAMAVLLRDALSPNLVQTLGGTPALIHAGPFANVAHGCNSRIATRGALDLADYVVTEAGFGADLGAEKFIHIKNAAGDLSPALAVVVATLRALRTHGGGSPMNPSDGATTLLQAGFLNLLRHVENLRTLGLPSVVALNRFEGDSEGDLRFVESLCAAAGIPVERADVHARGGTGALGLADQVLDRTAGAIPHLHPVSPALAPIDEKIRSLAQQLYRADGVDFTAQAEQDLENLRELGAGTLAVCMAKTPYSFTDDPGRPGAPTHFRITVRALTPALGAGFVVAHVGTQLSMPGLGRRPAATGMRLDPEGNISGLF